MKTAEIRCSMNKQVPLPNAATKKELVHKFLDLLLMGAIGAGSSALALFMLALC